MKGNRELNDTLIKVSAEFSELILTDRDPKRNYEFLTFICILFKTRTSYRIM